jgi:murein DD-endopeptidase MepM/ murein hydrolase activator NlpD/uncharacterized Zn-binding protein involved in type VI secretion
MGKPAARIGDSTAHGGVITGPGCPTVLIGGLPAATMGDMHVCPMVTPGTPPIPHVGGSILLGSTGVLIGGKPAARMGDIAMCVGPPSSIIMGCMTVLIGEAGGGGGGAGAGAGGAGAGGSGTAGAIMSSSIATQAPKTKEKGNHFFEAIFHDAANLIIGGLKYLIKFPNGMKSSGIFGDKIRLNGVAQGNYTIELRAIADVRWSQKEVEAGKQVNLIVETIGVEDGEKAILDIYVRDGNYTDYLLDTIETQVKGNKVDVKWEIKVNEKYLAICDIKNKKKKYSMPFLFFKAKIQELTEQSSHLYVKDKISLTVKDKNGEQISGIEYKIKLPTGEIKKGKTEKNKNIEISNIPFGKWEIDFKEKIKKQKENQEDKNIENSKTVNKKDEIIEDKKVLVSGDEKKIKEKDNLVNDNSNLKYISQKISKNDTYYIYPVQKNWVITSKYGLRIHPITKESKFHHGIDLVHPDGKTLGEPVLAIEEGIVSTIISKTAGNLIILNLKDGFSVRYAHLKEFLVFNGEKVKAGQQIGTVGNSGASTGAHLHFGMFKNQQSIDPTNFFNYKIKG